MKRSEHCLSARTEKRADRDHSMLSFQNNANGRCEAASRPSYCWYLEERCSNNPNQKKVKQFTHASLHRETEANGNEANGNLERNDKLVCSSMENANVVPFLPPPAIQGLRKRDRRDLLAYRLSRQSKHVSEVLASPSRIG